MSHKTAIDYNAVIKRCNGMLSPRVYQKIEETAATVQDGIILEIGTAHGAATIAMANGIKKSGAAANIITTDKVIGGSREQYGDEKKHLEIVNANFKHFDVDTYINANAKPSDKLKLPEGKPLRLIMIDADGAIDRDLLLFFDKITEGTPIIIDDYAPDFVRLYRHGKNVKVDQKQRLATSLIHYFEDKGILKRDEIIGGTWFGTKAVGAPRSSEFDMQEINTIYRELIFAEGELHSNFAEIISALTRKFPTVHRFLKSIYIRKTKEL